MEKEQIEERPSNFHFENQSLRNQPKLSTNTNYQEMMKKGTNYSIASNFLRGLKDSDRSIEKGTNGFNLYENELISLDQSNPSYTEELIPRRKNFRRVTTPFEGLNVSENKRFSDLN